MDLVRTTRLFGPVGVTNAAPQTIYTVPAGRTAIIRGLWVTNATSGTRKWALTLNGTTSAKQLLNYITLTSQANYQSELWWVLNENDVLRGYSDSATVDVILTAFGVLLPGASV